MDYSKHACLGDLENYLRRDSYLDKYSPVEQRQIRKNIGAIGENELTSYITKEKCTYLTHVELVDLIRNNSLGIGLIYAITDFLTIYLSNVLTSSGMYETWGLNINPSEVQTILTIALSPNKLYSRVIIDSIKYSTSSKWIVEYDYEPETLSDGVITKGKITYLKDNNNNVAYYDFKNIKSRRYKKALLELGINTNKDYLDLYTFNTLNFEEASESFNVYNNYFESGAKDNVFIGNECYNNVFEGGFRNNTFASSCHNNSFLFDTFNNTFKDSVIYLTGSFNNKKFIDNPYTSLDIDKQISKVDEGYALSYLDPDTLTLLSYKI